MKGLWFGRVEGEGSARMRIRAAENEEPVPLVDHTECQAIGRLSCMDARRRPRSAVVTAVVIGGLLALGFWWATNLAALDFHQIHTGERCLKLVSTFTKAVKAVDARGVIVSKCVTGRISAS